MASARASHGAPVFTSVLLVLLFGCEHAGALRHVRSFPALGLLRLLRPTLAASAGNEPSLRPQGRSGLPVWFPRSLFSVRQVRCPTMPLQLRRRYAAALHDGLPLDDINRARSSLHTVSRGGTRCNPARIRQVRAGGSLLRGVNPLVHCRYTFLSCSPDPKYLTVLPRPGFVGAAPAFTGVPRIGLPPACIRLLRQPERDGLPPSHGRKAPRGARYPSSRPRWVPWPRARGARAWGG